MTNNNPYLLANNQKLAQKLQKLATGADDAGTAVEASQLQKLPDLLSQIVNCDVESKKAEAINHLWQDKNMALQVLMAVSAWTKSLNEAQDYMVELLGPNNSDEFNHRIAIIRQQLANTQISAQEKASLIEAVSIYDSANHKQTHNNKASQWFQPITVDRLKVLLGGKLSEEVNIAYNHYIEQGYINDIKRQLESVTDQYALDPQKLNRLAALVRHFTLLVKTQGNKNQPSIDQICDLTRQELSDDLARAFQNYVDAIRSNKLTNDFNLSQIIEPFLSVISTINSSEQLYFYGELFREAYGHQKTDLRHQSQVQLQQFYSYMPENQKSINNPMFYHELLAPHSHLSAEGVTKLQDHLEASQLDEQSKANIRQQCSKALAAIKPFVPEYGSEVSPTSSPKEQSSSTTSSEGGDSDSSNVPEDIPNSYNTDNLSDQDKLFNILTSKQFNTQTANEASNLDPVFRENLLAEPQVLFPEHYPEFNSKDKVYQFVYDVARGRMIGSRIQGQKELDKRLAGQEQLDIDNNLGLSYETLRLIKYLAERIVAHTSSLQQANTEQLSYNQLGLDCSKESISTSFNCNTLIKLIDYYKNNVAELTTKRLEAFFNAIEQKSQDNQQEAEHLLNEFLGGRNNPILGKIKGNSEQANLAYTHTIGLAYQEVKKADKFAKHILNKNKLPVAQQQSHHNVLDKIQYAESVIKRMNKHTSAKEIADAVDYLVQASNQVRDITRTPIKQYLDKLLKPNQWLPWQKRSMTNLMQDYDQVMGVMRSLTNLKPEMASRYLAGFVQNKKVWNEIGSTVKHAAISGVTDDKPRISRIEGTYRYDKLFQAYDLGREKAPGNSRKLIPGLGADETQKLKTKFGYHDNIQRARNVINHMNKHTSAKEIADAVDYLVQASNQVRDITRTPIKQYLDKLLKPNQWLPWQKRSMTNLMQDYKQIANTLDSLDKLTPKLSKYYLSVFRSKVLEKLDAQQRFQILKNMSGDDKDTTILCMDVLPKTNSIGEFPYVYEYYLEQGKWAAQKLADSSVISEEQRTELIEALKKGVSWYQASSTRAPEVFDQYKLSDLLQPLLDNWKQLDDAKREFVHANIVYINYHQSVPINEADKSWLNEQWGDAFNPGLTAARSFKYILDGEMTEDGLKQALEQFKIASKNNNWSNDDKERILKLFIDNHRAFSTLNYIDFVSQIVASLAETTTVDSIYELSEQLIKQCDDKLDREEANNVRDDVQNSLNQLGSQLVRLIEKVDDHNLKKHIGQKLQQCQTLSQYKGPSRVVNRLKFETKRQAYLSRTPPEKRSVSQMIDNSELYQNDNSELHQNSLRGDPRLSQSAINNLNS